MNLVDILIILFAISALFRGRELGLVRQLLSAVGFFGGLWLGAALVQPHVLHLAHTPGGRSFVTILSTLGSALVFLTIGEYVGIILKRRVHQLHVIDEFDGVFGSGVAVASLLGAVWLSAAILLALPLPSLQQSLSQSAIISGLNKTLPPAPNVLAGIGKLIDPNGFPLVFTGGEPAPPSADLPSLGSLASAVKADEASVVKIEGQGCGGIVEGSGFVIGSDLVATNAHVVAGIQTPYVSDANGTRAATAIWFDPDLDFAVLRVDDLAGKPLVIDGDRMPARTPGAVLGYPGGGSFSAKPATVLDEFTATGRNIYNEGETERDVYELKATVIPGNSGGPLIAKDGTVIGVVFAQSTEYQQVGYALTTDQVLSEIHQAEAQNHQVSTGTCAE